MEPRRHVVDEMRSLMLYLPYPIYCMPHVQIVGPKTEVERHVHQQDSRSVETLQSWSRSRTG